MFQDDSDFQIMLFRICMEYFTCGDVKYVAE
jgi:hypothetical protein